MFGLVLLCEDGAKRWQETPAPQQEHKTLLCYSALDGKGKPIPTF